MSAFMVSDKHINTLLTWTNANYQGRIYTQKKDFDSSNANDLQLMANVLKGENIRSLEARYGNNTAEEMADFEKDILFNFTNGREFKPVEIIKLCNCYDYQSCESDDYDTTTANKIIKSIRACAVSMLPGYDQAKWDI
jgi:hypothetical protein|tara:strand:+ start:494 stop:907 length:414 start_codon:yes stop_codon:yes gene_type:complete